MSFRKRSAVIRGSTNSSAVQPEKHFAQGTRPSPLDGRLTTSSGTASLDQLMGGHAGLPLGSSLLVEEAGTSDFGGILLRYYASEGLVQGHHVHLLGAGEAWRRELPGLRSVDKKRMSNTNDVSQDRMKIAWRYGSLGSHTGPSIMANLQPRSGNADKPSMTETGKPTALFCHSFDLSERLESSSIRGKLECYPPDETRSSHEQAPFGHFLSCLAQRLKDSPTSSVHRILVPGLLNTTTYGPGACLPKAVLQFLHRLRSLLRQYSSRATALVTLSLSLHPRSAGLTRWIELLFDGVVELLPLSHDSHRSRGPVGEDATQGFFRIHSLPVLQEKGGGVVGDWVREDLSFKLTTSGGFIISPLGLPPVLTDEDKLSRLRKEDAKTEILCI